MLEKHDREYGYVIGRKLSFLGLAGLATLDEARKANQPLEKAPQPECLTIATETHLGEVLNVVATTRDVVPGEDVEWLEVP